MSLNEAQNQQPMNENQAQLSMFETSFNPLQLDITQGGNEEAVYKAVYRHIRSHLDGIHQHWFNASEAKEKSPNFKPWFYQVVEGGDPSCIETVMSGYAVVTVDEDGNPAPTQRSISEASRDNQFIRSGGNMSNGTKQNNPCLQGKDGKEGMVLMPVSYAYVCNIAEDEEGDVVFFPEDEEGVEGEYYWAFSQADKSKDEHLVKLDITSPPEEGESKQNYTDLRVAHRNVLINGFGYSEAFFAINGLQPATEVAEDGMIKVDADDLTIRSYPLADLVKAGSHALCFFELYGSFTYQERKSQPNLRRFEPKLIKAWVLSDFETGSKKSAKKSSKKAKKFGSGHGASASKTTANSKPSQPNKTKPSPASAGKGQSKPKSYASQFTWKACDVEAVYEYGHLVDAKMNGTCLGEKDWEVHDIKEDWAFFHKEGKRLFVVLGDFSKFEAWCSKKGVYFQNGKALTCDGDEVAVRKGKYVGYEEIADQDQDQPAEPEKEPQQKESSGSEGSGFVLNVSEYADENEETEAWAGSETSSRSQTAEEPAQEEVEKPTTTRRRKTSSIGLKNRKGGRSRSMN